MQWHACDEMPTMKCTLIAIAGGSGSGKTWLARELRRRLRPHAAILTLDDFYCDRGRIPMAERAACNFDAPGSLDWPTLDEVLAALRQGESVVLPDYDFTTHTRRPVGRRMRPKPVILVEGLWPWWRKGWRRYYDLRVFKIGDAECRLARRVQRDTRERGRSEASVRTQWRRQVQPMYTRFVAPQIQAADVVMPAWAPEWRLARLTAKIQKVAGLVVGGN